MEEKQLFHYLKKKMKEDNKILLASIIILGIAIFLPNILKQKVVTETKTEVKTKIHTVVKTDTVLISSPISVFWKIVPNDTIVIRDTVLQRKQVTYEDSLYKAVVSGYVDPRLDSIQVYPKTVFRTETNDIYHTLVPKKKRWGLGIHAGYGYPGGAYIGAGISYNLFTF